jgi:SSS family solute:Na+ symporter
MITGSSVAGFGIIAKQYDREFIFNGQQMYFFAMVSAVIVYVSISLIQNRSFDLDRILHRGKYRELLPPEERQKGPTQTGLATLGPGPDFTRKDRLVLWITLGMQASFFLSAIVISIAYLCFRFSDGIWFAIWFTLILIWIAKAIIAFIWLLIGGTADLKEAIVDLRSAKRNQLDDGSVTQGHNRGE